MKRVLIAPMIFFVCVAIVAVCYAQNLPFTTTSITKKTATGVVYAGKCWLTSINMFTDGSHDLTVTLYDSATAATGTPIGPFVLFGALKSDKITWPNGLLMKNGIWAVLSGTGDNATIEYGR